jgi:hypothetical protein
MKSLYLLFGALAALLLVAPAHLNAQEQDGQIRAFLVRGDVKITDTNGKTSQLRRGQTFGPGVGITAGPESSALLILSNGSTVNVTESTEMAIPTFKQAAFDRKQGSFITLEGDPSQSRTELNLENGTVAGEVKKIRENSSFRINTPAGSAGIRGTKYVVSFSRTTGMATFAISDGAADWTPIGGQPQDVPPGTEVETIINPDGTTQSSQNPISDQNQGTINNTINETNNTTDPGVIVNITTPGTTQPGQPGENPVPDQPPVTRIYSVLIAPDGSATVNITGAQTGTVILPSGVVSPDLIAKLFNSNVNTTIEVPLTGLIKVTGALTQSEAALLLTQLGAAIQAQTGINPFTESGNNIDIVNPAVISPAGD